MDTVDNGGPGGFSIGLSIERVLRTPPLSALDCDVTSENSETAAQDK